MTPRTQRLALGLFFALAGIVFVILYFMLGGQLTLWTTTNPYVIVLSRAERIGPGTPVNRSGVRIGQVESVDLVDETGQVRVNIAINRKYTIRANEEPLLTRSILGDVSIDFVTKPLRPLAEPDRSIIPPGSEIVGRTSPDLFGQASELVPATEKSVDEVRKAAENFNKMVPDLTDAVREIRNLAKTTRETIPDLQRTNQEIQVAAKNWGAVGERVNIFVRTNEDKISKAVDSLNDTLTRVGQVFNDENQRNFNRALKNTAQASDRFDSIAQNTDAFVQEARTTLKQLDKSLQQADKAMNNLERATKPLGDRSDSILRNLDESGDKLNKLLTDMRELLRVVGQEDGTVQRLLKDPTLYNNINDAACMVVRILPRVDRILRDMEVFADKLARHPESLGLGGAIRPGSGLK